MHITNVMRKGFNFIYIDHFDHEGGRKMGWGRLMQTHKLIEQSLISVHNSLRIGTQNNLLMTTQLLNPIALKDALGQPRHALRYFIITKLSL